MPYKINLVYSGMAVYYLIYLGFIRDGSSINPFEIGAHNFQPFNTIGLLTFFIIKLFASFVLYILYIL